MIWAISLSGRRRGVIEVFVVVREEIGRERTSRKR